MKPLPKRRGRPKKSSDQKQTEYLDVRCAAAEKMAFKQAAELAGMAVSAWVRLRLRECAAQELKSAGVTIPFLPAQSGG